MSKKNITTNEAKVETISELLKQRFEQYPNASLRKLAAATNTSYPVLLKRPKAPIVGQPYDPEATNWTAVAEYLEAHEIDIEVLDWEALNATKQRAGTVGVGKSLSDYEVGQKVWLRRDNEVPYQIVYRAYCLECYDIPAQWSGSAASYQEDQGHR